MKLIFFRLYVLKRKVESWLVVCSYLDLNGPCLKMINERRRGIKGGALGIFRLTR